MATEKGSFPRAYQGNVKQDDGLCVYVPFPTMDIGARKSGQPQSASSGPKSLEHVGDSASSRRSDKK